MADVARMDKAEALLAAGWEVVPEGPAVWLHDVAGNKAVGGPTLRAALDAYPKEENR